MPFHHDLSDSGEAEVDKIIHDLVLQFDEESSGRFVNGMEAALEKECVFLESGRRALAPEAHRRHRDLYALTFRGWGQWRVLYEVKDADEDGQLDTLLVVSVVSATGSSVRL